MMFNVDDLYVRYSNVDIQSKILVFQPWVSIALNATEVEGQYPSLAY